MTSRALNDPSLPPAALAAFLRGVRRRAVVFARMQGGEAGLGDRAAAAAMAAFAGNAAQLPVADWPYRFWSLLLATPLLRQDAPQPRWPAEFAVLATLGRGPRAALLLCLVAGLSEEDAAAALGVAPPTYCLALQRALPQQGDGLPDLDAWQRLGEALQQALRQLVLAPAPATAVVILEAEDAPPRRAATGAGHGQRARWVRPLAIATAALCTLALASTFVLPQAVPAPAPPGAGDARIDIEPLPPAQPPAVQLDRADAVLTHPDFELLMAGDAGAAARDPGFYAWLAAGTPATGAAQAPVRDAPAASAVEAPPESLDAP